MCRAYKRAGDDTVEDVNLCFRPFEKTCFCENFSHTFVLYSGACNCCIANMFT